MATLIKPGLEDVAIATSGRLGEVLRALPPKTVPMEVLRTGVSALAHNRLIRPRAEYTGPRQATYVPIDQR